MKTKIHSAILMLVAAAALVATTGCTTPATRIKANQQLFASIAPANQELIKQGKIALGFTPDMVRLALGEPDIIAQHTDASGTSEIWRYQNLDNNAQTYVYANYYAGGWWGGPMYSPTRGGWGWGGAWGYPAWGWSAPLSDYLRLSFRDGRVIEINRLR